MKANIFASLSLYAFYGIEEYMNAKFWDLDSFFFHSHYSHHSSDPRGFAPSVMELPLLFTNFVGILFQASYGQEASSLTQ